MRTRQFLKNSTSTALYQIVVMLAGLITPRIMLAHYGSEINGLVSSIRQFLNYFYLVEAGLSGAAIYALYKPLAKKNVKSTNEILSATHKLYKKSGWIFLFLALGLAIIFPLYIQTSSLSIVGVGALVLILGAYGAMDLFTLGKYRALLTADQKTYVISLASILYVVVNTIIIVVLGIREISIVLLQFVALLAIFLRSFILMGYTKKEYPLADYNEKPNFEALDRRWDALYLQILGMIQIGAPTVILTIISRDLKIISVYAIFNMVTTGINGILGIFKSGLQASFGEVIAKGEKQTLQRSYDEFELGYYLIITVVYSVAFILIMPFVNLYTGGITDINYNQPIIGFLFVLNGLLYSLKNPQGMLIYSAGHFRETRTQVTIQGAIVVILGFILAPLWGIEGVLIASILSNLYRDIGLLFYVPKYITQNSWKRSALRMATVLLTTAAILLPSYFVKISILSLWDWVFHAILAVIFATTISVIVSYITDQKTLKSIILRVLNTIKKS